MVRGSRLEVQGCRLRGSRVQGCELRGSRLRGEFEDIRSTDNKSKVERKSHLKSQSKRSKH